MQPARELSSQLLLFCIEDNYFCCPSEQVLTLIAPPTLTRVPFMPDFGRGAFDYQGQTASVISMRHKLHFADPQDRADGVILLSRIKGKIAGFWIDAVDEVIESNMAAWLTMPEGFQDDVFQRAISFEDKTAFYIDLASFWQHQQQTFIDIHQIDRSQLQAIDEPAEPVTDMRASTDTIAVTEDLPAIIPTAAESSENVAPIEPEPEPEPEPEQQSIVEEMTSPVETSLEIEAFAEAEPIVEEEISELPRDNSIDDDYKVAASHALVVEQFVESKTDDIKPITALPHNFINTGEGDKPRSKRKWLVLLIPLLLLIPLFNYYLKKNSAIRHIEDPEPLTTPQVPPVSDAIETKLSIELPDVTITVQKTAIENPPAHVYQHVVNKGDTLWDISSHYLHNPWRYPELAQNNAIRNPNLIYPGDVVVIDRRAADNSKP